MKYYLPGCDVRRNHPEASAKMVKFIKSKGIEIAQCCRKDLSFLKEGDSIIENCTLCELMLKERVPSIPFQSLYEYLLTTDFEWPDHHGEEMVIQDCFRVRDNPALHNAVREALKRMNVQIIEAENNREKSEYCGVWLNNPPAADCVELAPDTFTELEKYRNILTEQEQEEKMTEHVKQYHGKPAAVYCNGCEKGIKLGKGNPIHIIELVTRDL
jgi:hypothetical protein